MELLSLWLIKGAKFKIMLKCKNFLLSFIITKIKPAFYIEKGSNKQKLDK